MTGAADNPRGSDLFPVKCDKAAPVFAGTALSYYLIAETALGTNTVFVQSDTAFRTAVNRTFYLKFFGCDVVTAAEGDFADFELILQQVVCDFYHSFYRHAFFCNYKAALGESGCKVRAEGFAPHRVLGMAVLNALVFVNVYYCGQERVVLTQNECVVKILEDVPSRLFDFVAGENHIYARFNAVFDLNREGAGVTVKVLGFASETVKSVSVLNIKRGYTSHNILRSMCNSGIQKLNLCSQRQLI